MVGRGGALRGCQRGGCRRVQPREPLLAETQGPGLGLCWSLPVWLGAQGSRGAHAHREAVAAGTCGFQEGVTWTQAASSSVQDTLCWDGCLDPKAPGDKGTDPDPVCLPGSC